MTGKSFTIRFSLISVAVACAGAWMQSNNSPSQFLQDTPVTFTEVERRRILQHEQIALPQSPTNLVADNPAAAHFGQYLFFDKRFSKDGSVSCATCHDPEKGFSDNLELGKGLGELARHSPSLWNSAYNRWFFWDGRADSLWAQALGPVEHPLEVGGSRLGVAHAIYKDKELRQAYEKIFETMPDLSDSSRFPLAGKPVPDDTSNPDHIAWMSMTREDRYTISTIYANFGKAIAAYERKLIVSESPFDRFLKWLNDSNEKHRDAITDEAKRGLKLFVGKANCRLCHTGPNFTDSEFHNNGLPPLKGEMPVDQGRFDGINQLRNSEFNASGLFSDAPGGDAAKRVKRIRQIPETWGEFKTPGLRNIAHSPPYMHQGQFESLRKVIHFYSTLENQVQIGHHKETTLIQLNLTDDEIDDLIAFLNALSGEFPDPILQNQPNSPIHKP